MLLTVRRAFRNLIEIGRGYGRIERDDVALMANLEDCGQVCCGFVGTNRCHDSCHRQLAEEEEELRDLLSY